MTNQKIRVLHCIYKVGSGGVERRRLTLVKELDSNDYEQVLVCTQSEGPLQDEFESAGCEVIDVGKHKHIFDPNPYLKTLKVIKNFNPDIVHGAVYEGVALASVCGRIGRVPIIIGEETTDPKRRRFRGHMLYRFFCSLTHRMVAVSPAVETYLVNGICNPRRKVTLINNGVPERSVKASDVRALKKEIGIPAGAFVIGTVGRLFEQPKRITDLIRAMKEILAVTPEAYLLIVGDGPDRARFERLSADLGVAHRVLFVGYQADTAPYYRLMDAFALVSEYEGLPLVVIEAMFAGVPVLATNVGGTPSVILDGETGILIEPRNVDSIVESIKYYYLNREDRIKMGRNGLKRARDLYSAGRYVADVDNLYKSLLRVRRVP